MDRRHTKRDQSEINGDTDIINTEPEPKLSGTDQIGNSEPVETDNGITQQPIESENRTGETSTRNRGGRPKGSKNRITRTAEQTSFSVSEKTVKPSKKRTEKEPERQLFTPDESKAATETILAIVEGLSVSTFGESAQFTSIERTLLEESIPRMLERMSAKTAENTANILYPAMLGFASVSYAIRLVRMNNEKRKEQQLYAVEVPSSNGQYDPDSSSEPVSFNPNFGAGRGLN